MPTADVLDIAITANTGQMESAFQGADAVARVSTDDIITQLNLMATESELTAARMNESMMAAGEAPRHVMSGYTEARHAAMLFGEEVGVRIPRAIGMTLAASETIGPILEAAFPLLAAGMFLDILVRIIEKIYDYATGAKEAAAKTKVFEEAIKTNYAEMNRAATETQKLRLEYDAMLISTDKNEQKLITLEAQLRTAKEEVMYFTNQLSNYAVQQGYVEKGTEQWKLYSSQLAVAKARVDELTAALATTGQDYAEELARKQAEANAKIAAANAKLQGEIIRAYQEQGREFTKMMQDEDRAVSQSLESQLRLELKNSDEKIKTNQAEMDGLEKTALAKVDLSKKTYDDLYREGRISAADELAVQQQLADDEYAIKLEFLQERLRLAEIDPDGAPQRAKINAEIEQLEIAHQRRMEEIRHTGAVTAQRDNEALYANMNQSFNRALDQMMVRSKSWADLTKNLWEDLFRIFDRVVAQMLTSWILAEETKTAWSFKTALKKIMHEAYSAAAATYSAVSGIPIVGPILAPPAAAVAFAAVAAFGSGMPSAAGGWVVPSDTIAQVHQNEMILPAHISQGLLAMTQKAGAGPMSDTPLHAHFEIHAIDAKGVAELLLEQGETIVNVLKQQMRYGMVPA